MEIRLNGRLAAVKDGTQINMTFENPLFGGSEGYSLEITFPLKGCNQNLNIFGHINRRDVETKAAKFDCDIIHGAVCLNGVLVITSVSESSVSGQFLSGRSVQNYDETFDKVYINELDLGEFPEGSFTGNWPGMPDLNMRKFEDAMEVDRPFVAIPWVNNSTGNLQNRTVLRYSSNGTPYYAWYDVEYPDGEKYSGGLSFQIYLTALIERIFSSLGFTLLDGGNPLYEAPLKDLVLMNTFPYAWDETEIRKVLPHWTVEEFMTEVEKFAGGVFSVDYQKKRVSFRSNESYLQDESLVEITTAVDDYEKTVSEEDESDYIGTANLMYSGTSWDSVWKRYSCDWLVDAYLKGYEANPLTPYFVNMETMAELSAKYKVDKTASSSDGQITATWRKHKYNALMYVREIDTYFAYYVSGYDYSSNRDDRNQWTFGIKPVNMFGNSLGAPYEDQPTIELKICPVADGDTSLAAGSAVFLEPGDFDYTPEAGEAMQQNDNGVWRTGPFRSLRDGEQSSEDAVYDKLFVGFWLGVDAHLRLTHSLPWPPITDTLQISDEAETHFTGYPKHHLRLRAAETWRPQLPAIDPLTKYSIKFIEDRIPDINRPFIIDGKKYLCAKMETQITDRPGKLLIKGEFYQYV